MLNNPIILGAKLPALSNPGTAGDLLTGKQLIDQNGNVLTGTMPALAQQTITPGTSDKIIASGRYLAGTQTIQGSANLVPGNIKSGVSIFGVAGSYAGPGTTQLPKITAVFYPEGNGLTDSATSASTTRKTVSIRTISDPEKVAVLQIHTAINFSELSLNDSNLYIYNVVIYDPFHFSTSKLTQFSWISNSSSEWRAVPGSLAQSPKIEVTSSGRSITIATNPIDLNFAFRPVAYEVHYASYS